MSSKIFNSSLVAIHIIREAITLKTPAYVGMSILDLSETLVYDFKYSYIESKYHDKEKLLFANTDSLIYQIDTEDVYKDFWADKNKFHNSEYAENSPFFDETNKKVIGKFKDEASGVRRPKINV